MKNLSIEQQKELEKMIAEINRLNQENDDLTKSHNKKERRLNNINKNLIKEIDKLKEDKLELIKENTRLNKKIESYEKERIKSLEKSDSELEEDFKEYYEDLQKSEYCE